MNSPKKKKATPIVTVRNVGRLSFMETEEVCLKFIKNGKKFKPTVCCSEERVRF